MRAAGDGYSTNMCVCVCARSRVCARAHVQVRVIQRNEGHGGEPWPGQTLVSAPRKRT